MTRALSRVYLVFLIACVIGLAAPQFYGQQPAKPDQPPENLQLYLRIGESNMAGKAEIPQDAGAIIDRMCLIDPGEVATVDDAVTILKRDRKNAREFQIRNQDKILWATDEGWWSFGGRAKQMNQHYTFFEELNLPAECAGRSTGAMPRRCMV